MAAAEAGDASVSEHAVTTAGDAPAEGPADASTSAAASPSSLAPTLTCSVCGRAFAGGPGARSNLLRHMRTHTDDRAFPCTQCQSAFTTLQNLRRHISAKHPGAPVPASRAQSRAASRGPSRATSTAVTPNAMGVPSFSFPMTTMDSNTSADVGGAPATAAGARSDPPTSPTVISPTHSVARSIPAGDGLQCPACDRKFAYKNSLRFHMRQAHPEVAGGGAGGGAQEVECPHCFALLSSRPKLNRHLQKHCVFRHEAPERRRNRGDDGAGIFDDDDNDDGTGAGGVSPVEREVLISAPIETSAPSRRRHRCNSDGCFATFATRRALREHRAREHPDDAVQRPDPADGGDGATARTSSPTAPSR